MDDGIGELIGLGIGLIVLDKVVDTIHEHHHEEKKEPKRRKVESQEGNDTWGGIF